MGEWEGKRLEGLSDQFWLKEGGGTQEVPETKGETPTP